MSCTLTSILSSQSALLKQAAETLPHSFSQCTYSKGPIRQAVYLCLTCASPRGICSACSIACHTEHEQLELFPKRHFRCDCPTSALPHACTLHHTPEEPNEDNVYGQNFEGKFCRCGRKYNPTQERETMIQCLACEDWYHESCLNLRERPSSREPSEEPAAKEQEGDDAASIASGSSSDLPPPLIGASSYESLVCRACILKIDALKKVAGTPGALMVVRDSAGDKWKIIGKEPEDRDNAQVDAEPEAGKTIGDKRERVSATNDAHAPAAKRQRTTPESSTSNVPQVSPCLAPPPNSIAQAIFENFGNAAKTSSDDDGGPHGAGDVFLTEGFRERWCRCPACLPSLDKHRYLLEEEETYEPPEDPDSGLSLEELGMRALERLPREQAINGIRAFNAMRDELINHLRPFAQTDREVTEADIRSFFEERMQSSR